MIKIWIGIIYMKIWQRCKWPPTIVLKAKFDENTINSKHRNMKEENEDKDLFDDSTVIQLIPFIHYLLLTYWNCDNLGLGCWRLSAPCPNA